MPSPSPREASYKIVRYFRGDYTPRIIKRGLSLEEALAHCNDPETSSETAGSREALALTREFGFWFDGYREEEAPMTRDPERDGE